MKIIVTHLSPDWDAIGGVWVIKKFLPGWQEAAVEFVPAGGRRVGPGKYQMAKHGEHTEVIEMQGKDEVIHVDTGLGPLDHHETSDLTVSGTSRAWDYVLSQVEESGSTMTELHKKAVNRVVNFIVGTDHFKEVFWPDAAADRYEFTILGVLEGLKLLKPEEHDYYVSFGREVLESLFHTFENRIQAEEEIKDKGVIFETKRGKGIGFETGNDTVLKLAQKMGYHLVVRKDPKVGFVRIKVRPPENKVTDIDLTLAYERFRKMDPDATWFLHISKKMLLNGGSKNPHQVPTNLSLQRIIDVLKELY